MCMPTEIIILAYTLHNDYTEIIILAFTHSIETLE